MDYTRNPIHELDDKKTKEIERSQLVKAQERAKRLGVWMKTAKELNAELAKRMAEVKEKIECRNRLRLRQ